MPFAWWKSRPGASPAPTVTPPCDHHLAAPGSEPAGNSRCQSCGACCAFFLVAFPSAEACGVANGATPSAVTAALDEKTSYMKGTEKRWARRCIALEGSVGRKVRCTIYANRPSPCRQFFRSWQDDIGNSLCDKARSAYGLEPFSQY